MSLESKKAVAIGNKKIIESLCGTCAYKGCTNCPSLVPIPGREEQVKDFQQVKRGIELKNGKIIVLSCTDYLRTLKKEEKIQTPNVSFEWDLRQRKFVKVIK